MDVILKQLGELVLGSVPTIVLFSLLVVAYGFLVRRPLTRVLAERHARTTGAMEQAKGAIAAAESEAASYEERLRKAKAEIYAAREQRLAQWNAEREEALGIVRKSAQDRVEEAKSSIEQSAAAARTEIEAASSELSARVLSAVLPAGVVRAEEVAR